MNSPLSATLLAILAGAAQAYILQSLDTADADAAFGYQSPVAAEEQSRLTACDTYLDAYWSLPAASLCATGTHGCAAHEANGNWICLDCDQIIEHGSANYGHADMGT